TAVRACSRTSSSSGCSSASRQARRPRGPAPVRRSPVDRQIKRLAFAMAVLFAILFAQLNWIQVFAASKISNNPANFRLIIDEYKVERGSILASDLRTVLAKSMPTSGQLKFLRRYPDGPLYADITGYYSLIYGRS